MKPRLARINEANRAFAAASAPSVVKPADGRFRLPQGWLVAQGSPREENFRLLAYDEKENKRLVVVVAMSSKGAYVLGNPDSPKLSAILLAVS